MKFTSLQLPNLELICVFIVKAGGMLKNNLIVFCYKAISELDNRLAFWASADYFADKVND